MNYELPEQFAQFGDARKNGFLRVKSIKENGGKVAGTFCTFTPQEILEGVYRNVQHFVGDAPQFDDLTMLGLEYRGKEE